MSAEGNYKQRALKNYKANPSALLASSFAFFLLCLIAVGLTIVYPLLGLLAICLLVLPFLFGFTALLRSYVIEKRPPSNKDLLAPALSYFRQPYLGAYRVMTNILKTIGFFFIAFIACVLLSGYILSQVNAEFAAVLNDTLSLYIKGDPISALTALENAEISALWLNYSETFAIGVAVLLFAFFIHNYLMRPMIQFSRVVLPGGAGAFHYQKFYERTRKGFHRLGLRDGMLLYFVLPLSLFVPMGIMMSFKIDPSIIIVASLATFALALAAYLPYYLLLVMEYFIDNKKAEMEAELDVFYEIKRRMGSGRMAYSSDGRDLDSIIANLEKSLQNNDEKENDGTLK